MIQTPILIPPSESFEEVQQNDKSLHQLETWKNNPSPRKDSNPQPSVI